MHFCYRVVVAIIVVIVLIVVAIVFSVLEFVFLRQLRATLNLDEMNPYWLSGLQKPQVELFFPLW